MGVTLTTGEVRWRGRGEDGLADSPSWNDGTARRGAVSRRSLKFLSGGARESRGGDADGALGGSWAARATGALPMLSFR